jgi:predicted MFS family arabinose efflux permease
MERLYTPILGLSKEIVLGLPISTEMFFAATAIILAGVWLDKRGWKEPFLCGLMLSGLGTLYSWLAPDSMQFIASRGVVGLGYGLFWMACQGFVLANTGTEKTVQGLAVLFAGIYAGNICGSAAGALLAERIGYSRIFLFGAVVTFLAAAYSLTFIRSGKDKPEKTVSDKLYGTFSLKAVAKYLTNPGVLGLILLSSIPSSLAVIGFLHYFSPLYLHRIGATQSGIGRVFMIYGICLILIAPTISKYIDAAASKKKFIVIGGLTGSLGLIVFQFFGGYIAVVATVLLLGLSGSFDASRNAYALNLKVTHELGVGKAIGTLSMGGRIGQVIGPITLGWLILSVGVNQATTLLGLIYLGTTLVFILITRSDRRSEIAGAPDAR